MKFSNKEIVFCLMLVFLSLAISYSASGGQPQANYAQVNDLTLREPEGLQNFEDNIPSPMEIKNLPNFPTHYVMAAGNRISTTPTVIPLNTRFRLLVDSDINAKTSMVGDYFKAHVLEDFYLPTNPPQLLVPAKSWVRGKVSYLKKPNLFSMTGKIGLHLYQLVTPLTEVATLDAEVDVQQGTVGNEGLLNPIVNSDNIAIAERETVLVPELGLLTVAKLMKGELKALIFGESSATLAKGQELQVVLEKDLQLSIN